MASGKSKIPKFLSKKNNKKIILNFKPVISVRKLQNIILNAKNVIKFVITFVAI
jgi:hypothetical protein